VVQYLHLPLPLHS